MNHKKSRLTDLFRKMDKDNNGLIPRDVFIDGIINTSKENNKTFFFSLLVLITFWLIVFEISFFKFHQNLIHHEWKWAPLQISLIEMVKDL